MTEFDPHNIEGATGYPSQNPPANLLNNGLPMGATIAAVSGGPVGPAADISYTIRLNLPNGGMHELSNVTPSHRRPFEDVDIKAAEVGDALIVFDSADGLKFVIFEGYETTTDCETA